MTTKANNTNHASNTRHDPRFDIFLRVIVELARRTHKERKEIAKAAHVAHSSYGHWLTGHVTHPRIDTLIKTAHVLGYTVELRKLMRKAQLRRVK